LQALPRLRRPSAVSLLAPTGASASAVGSVCVAFAQGFWFGFPRSQALVIFDPQNHNGWQYRSFTLNAYRQQPNNLSPPSLTAFIDWTLFDVKRAKSIRIFQTNRTSSSIPPTCECSLTDL
jgi:hypothetical protein